VLSNILLIIITIELTICTFYIITKLIEDYRKRNKTLIRRDSYQRKYFNSVRERLNGV